MNNYLFQADNLHTDLHECLGHGSGKLLPGVDPDALKAYSSTLKEARADLFALYYMPIPKYWNQVFFLRKMLTKQLITNT